MSKSSGRHRGISVQINRATSVTNDSCGYDIAAITVRNE
jgi:hypothetical protein